MKWKDFGSVGSSVRVDALILVGGMNVAQSGVLVWPLVPVHVGQPGEQPWLNHRHGCPFVSGRPVAAGQPPFGSVHEHPECAPTLC